MHEKISAYKSMSAGYTNRTKSFRITKGKRMMCTVTHKKRSARRISIWTLIFVLMLGLVSAAMLPAHAENFLNDAGDAVRNAADGAGEAISDAGDAVGDAVNDMASGDSGRVEDSDGIIGNESAETADPNAMDEDTKSGWIGVVIAIVGIVVVIVLIIVLVPKKKEK